MSVDPGGFENIGQMAYFPCSVGDFGVLAGVIPPREVRRPSCVFRRLAR
jgi:hypothetical protein